MNERFFRILTIVFFILAVLILLITLLLVYTPLKDLFFKKPTAEVTTEELTKETTLKEQTTQEPTEETEETSEEPTTKEEPTEEIITIEKDTVPPETESGTITHVDEAKHQGFVKDIDYENRIIIIINEITGVIVKLDDFSDYFSVSHYSSHKSKEFEDIKVGYYIFVMTEKEAGFNIYKILGKEPNPSHNYNKIYEIILIEEVPPPGWSEEEK